MADISELGNIFKVAANAAGAQLSTSGRNLSGDIQNFVLPELEHLASQIALILSRTGPNGLGQDAARHMVTSEVSHTVTRITMVAAELVLTEVQRIINAALEAAATVVNTAFGFKLF